MQHASIPTLLAQAGVAIVAGDANTITYRDGGRAVTADVIVANRVKSPTSILDRVHRHPGRRVLVVCDTIAEQARSALLQLDTVDICIGATGEAVLSGIVYRGSTSERERRAVAERRRRQHAAQRVCVLTREHLRQKDIAEAIGVSQQAVSQMADKHNLPITPMDHRARSELLNELAQIPADDGLVETYWYGTDSVVAQVSSAIALGEELTVRLLAGGEVAADGLRPWRLPTRGLVYASELVDLSVIDLVEATAEEATLALRVPADPTVWTTATWWQQAAERAMLLPIVDPVVVVEDLTAGPDPGDDAVARLIDWIVAR